jgi:hypothetical protein
VKDLSDGLKNEILRFAQNDNLCRTSNFEGMSRFKYPADNKKAADFACGNGKRKLILGLADRFRWYKKT